MGILGTVIIHLTAGIIFMSYQLGSMKTREKEIEKFEIEFAEVEERMEMAPAAPAENLSAVTVENVLRNDPEMLNIARNLAARGEEKMRKFVKVWGRNCWNAFEWCLSFFLHQPAARCEDSEYRGGHSNNDSHPGCRSR